jgi:PPIC-type PPIASE domain
MFRRWLREPLLHFFVAGVALFAMWEGRSHAVAARADRIVVSAATVETLAGNWARLRHRPPTAAELEGLIDDHIREEVLYREALVLGLDKDDTIIRRRLRQKLEFVSEDVAAQVEPTDAQLEAFLSENPDAFRVEPRHAFRHVFLSPGRRGAALGRDAERLLAALNRPGDTEKAEEESDPFLLPFEFDATSSEEVKRLFGAEFAAALATLDPGRWQGPIRSGYGAHLVLVERRVPGRVPALGEVRDAVRREWMAKARRDANEAFYQRLRSRYTVAVERPGGAAVEPAQPTRP